MAFLNGHSMPVYGAAYGTPAGAGAAPSAAQQPARIMDASGGFTAITGTPVRIVVLAFAAAAGLTALKVAGFRFSVGVSA
jgi:hypothetical protein